MKLLSNDIKCVDQNFFFDTKIICFLSNSSILSISLEDFRGNDSFLQSTKRHTFWHKTIDLRLENQDFHCQIAMFDQSQLCDGKKLEAKQGI